MSRKKFTYYACCTVHCPKNNLNPCIKSIPFPVWTSNLACVALKTYCSCIWLRNQTYVVASAPAMTDSAWSNPDRLFRVFQISFGTVCEQIWQRMYCRFMADEPVFIVNTNLLIYFLCKKIKASFVCKISL